MPLRAIKLMVNSSWSFFMEALAFRQLNRVVWYM